MLHSRKVVLASVVVALAVVLATAAQAENFRAYLSGAQEVPPRNTPATGFGCFRYDRATGLLSYEISYQGLLAPETASHIHGYAPPGVNAGVLIPLPVGTPKIGSVPLTAAQLQGMLDGLTYVNVHTSLYPGGEIRGQILISPHDCAVPVDETTWGSVKSMYR